MEPRTTLRDSDMAYPLLYIPKKCTTLEINHEATDNVFIDLNITSPDVEGKEMCIYSGFCNVKLIETYDANIQHIQSPVDIGSSSCVEIEQPAAIINDIGAQVTFPPYNQSQVWIDPARSPYVYNQFDTMETQEYSVHHENHTTSHITVEQHNTYITQNVYNYKEAVHYSSVEDFEHKKFRKVAVTEPTMQQSNPETCNFNLYEEDEFECGVFLSQLSEEIMNEKENKAREERKYRGLQSGNGALKQLMSTEIQSASKQHKTILFLGHDSHTGQTIQKISINDPSLECSGIDDKESIDHRIDFDDEKFENHRQKKYQCDKCKQIFDQISAFKQHMVGNHRSKTQNMSDLDPDLVGEMKFICTECGKTLKTQEKFHNHCMGHGDPELECNKCRKVFASKFTLRTHRKIHSRKFSCSYCTKSYSEEDDLRSHIAKIHSIFSCDSCEYVTSNYTELLSHQENHTSGGIKESSETDLAESLSNETDIIIRSPQSRILKQEQPAHMSSQEDIIEADSIIAKVMSNEIFLLHSKRARKHRKCNKTCDVCFKMFDRVGDLKRHLIEHVIRSTLAKTPVSKDGTLDIQCEVCKVETFTKVERYKAHLREHAKLTLYKCTFCDKSFSDSSNFSKHKKIHGTSYLQCDLCQRKFNSKKMITQHMEYHRKHSPVQCSYCNKVFHFESMLNKHIKCAHTKQLMNRCKCKFCFGYFKSLREKWDHEWRVHKVRKMIVDCLICGTKFRKYSDLKRHCTVVHTIEIPSAKKLLRKLKENKS